MNKTNDLLIAKALATRDNAHAPYSNFHVGAALVTEDGEVFSGCNMENISYGITSCAEFGAFHAATTAKRFNKVRKIVVVGGPKVLPDGGVFQIVTPCGRCRQLIAESAMASGFDIPVICFTPDLKIVKEFTISGLLPDSFDLNALTAGTN